MNARTRTEGGPYGPPEGKKETWRSGAAPGGRDARSLLEGYQAITRRIRAKMEMARRYREQAEGINVRLNGMPGGGSKDPSPMARAVAAYVTLEQEAAADVERLVEKEKEIRALIGEVRDERSRLILEERYINGYKWARIARDAHCSYDNVFYLHRQALRAFEKNLENFKT